MRLLLALLLALPMSCCMSGCGGGGDVPALTEPGKDPPPEQQKNWMEESKNRGSGPKTKGKPGSSAPAATTPEKK